MRQRLMYLNDCLYKVCGGLGAVLLGTGIVYGVVWLIVQIILLVAGRLC